MSLLLGFTASPAAPRVPVADASAAALVGVLVAGSNPAAQQALASALARDPGLALWAVCRCHHLGWGEQRTVEALAARLLEASGSALGDGIEVCVQVLDDPSFIGRFAAMAASAVSVARRASEAADEQEPARAYLLGLLHARSEWLLRADEVAKCDDWLPAWLDEKGSGVGGQEVGSRKSEVGEGIGNRESGIGISVSGAPQAGSPSRISDLKSSNPIPGTRYLIPDTNPPSAIRNPQSSGIEPNDARNAWLAAVPGIAHWLPALIARLRRLQSLESELQQTLAAEKLASLAELAAGAGHEINNPLAVISGRAQVLIRDERDPERRHALAAINAQALRVHEMIADMMLFARPPQPKLAPVDVADIARRVIESLGTRAAEAEIELACDLPLEPLLIDADCTQLIVGLKALCENSLEAIGQQGRIEVIVRSACEPVPAQNPLTLNLRPLTPTSVELIVRDNGPGIPAEVRRHIFDPFYSGRSAGRGIGFGLCKCWRIVTNHGGTIGVESTPGAGAEFRIVLPIQQARRASSPDRQLTTPPGSRRMGPMPTAGPPGAPTAPSSPTSHPSDRS